MSQSLPNSSAKGQAVNPDIARPRAAKVRSLDVGIPDISQERSGKQQFGAAFGRALSAARWSLDRAAAELKRDAREIGKWITGDRRGHWDLVFALPDDDPTYGREYQVLKEAFLAELAIEFIGRAEVERTIRFRRGA